MRFFAFHGVHPSERKTGQWYTINLDMEADTAEAEQYDVLDGTVDYAAVYHCCSKVMSVPVKLIEHLNASLGHALLKQFSRIHNVRVEVIKHNPPFDGFMDSASFISTFRRNGI